MNDDPEFRKLVRDFTKQSGMPKQAVEEVLMRLLAQGSMPEEVIHQFGFLAEGEKTNRLVGQESPLFRRTLELLSEWGLQQEGLKKTELQELRFKLIELTAYVEKILDEEF